MGLFRDHAAGRSNVPDGWTPVIVISGKRFGCNVMPAYSPGLNPDEHLNRDVKSSSVGRRRPRDAREMIASVRGYLRGAQRPPELAARYFHAERVRYAAAM